MNNFYASSTTRGSSQNNSQPNYNNLDAEFEHLLVPANGDYRNQRLAGTMPTHTRATKTRTRPDLIPDDWEGQRMRDIAMYSSIPKKNRHQNNARLNSSQMEPVYGSMVPMGSVEDFSG